MIAPYPFERLPKVTRQEVGMLARIAHRISRVNVSSGQSVATTLLGASISCELRLPELFPHRRIRQRLFEPLVIALVEDASNATRHRCLIELPCDLAAVIVDRTLGGDGSQAVPQSLLGLDELSRGVLSYFVARVLQGLGGTYRLRAVLSDLTSALAILGNDSAIVLPMLVRLGDVPYTIHIWIPGGTAESVRQSINSHSIADMEAVQITLIATAGSTCLTANEWLSIGNKDVVILDTCDLRRDQTQWTGTVRLVVDGAARTVWRCKALDNKLEIESISTNQEMAVEQGAIDNQQNKKTEDVLKLAGDAPVEISVEIARFTLTLAELGALKPGEILLTRHPIGEHVTLRVGRQSYALGELVDVEGEIGVRILNQNVSDR